MGGTFSKQFVMREDAQIEAARAAIAAGKPSEEMGAGTFERLYPDHKFGVGKRKSAIKKEEKEEKKEKKKEKKELKKAKKEWKKMKKAQRNDREQTQLDLLQGEVLIATEQAGGGDEIFEEELIQVVPRDDFEAVTYY